MNLESITFFAIVAVGAIVAASVAISSLTRAGRVSQSQAKIDMSHESARVNEAEILRLRSERGVNLEINEYELDGLRHGVNRTRLHIEQANLTVELEGIAPAHTRNSSDQSQVPTHEAAVGTLVTLFTTARNSRSPRDIQKYAAYRDGVSAPGRYESYDAKAILDDFEEKCPEARYFDTAAQGAAFTFTGN